MRCLKRNKQQFHYSLYIKKEPIKDEYGNQSGEYKVLYSDPVRCKGNISVATGSSETEQFGSSIEYDKVIVIDDTNCPIEESSVLFIDKEPTRDDDGNLLFDYIVKKVAKSLNSVSIAISKVEIS